MLKQTALLVLALSFCLSPLAQTSKGTTLETQAAALSAAGKLHEAGDAYSRAAKAYTTEGNSSAATRAYGKAAELYEQEADALLKSQGSPANTKTVPLVTKATIVPQPPVPLREIRLSPLVPRAGMIVGRVVSEAGQPAAHVTVKYSGFQDGKPIINHFENSQGSVQGEGGSYAMRVPPGTYRVSAYATYAYHGRSYNFELEAHNPPAKHDLEGLGLDHLRGGLVRDFVLKMTAKKAHASEETETVYQNAYYGGRLGFDCGQVERILGGGHTFTPPLTVAYPPDSRLQVTLTPQGPLVDGSTGRVVQIDLRLGDHGTYPFSKRGIFPGVYTATAHLTTPTGELVPLRLALTRARTILKGSPDGYDMLVMDWKPSVTVDFLPSDIGPIPRFGVKPIELFPGK